jgi:hypothetical protein
MYDWRLACNYCSMCNVPGDDCGAPLEKDMKIWRMVEAGLIICPWFKPLPGERVGKAVYLVDGDSNPASSRNPVIVKELKKLGYRECSFNEWRAAEMAQSVRKKELR